MALFIIGYVYGSIPHGILKITILLHNKIHKENMICPNCNAHNIPNVANFCPNCGVTFDKRKLAAQKRKQKTRLKKEAEEAWERYPSKPKLRTNVYAICFWIILFVIIASGILIYQYLKTNYSHVCIPEWINIAVTIYGNAMLSILIYLGLRAINFDALEDYNLAKIDYINKYIKEHQDEM